jgi:hypothetical protein
MRLEEPFGNLWTVADELHGAILPLLRAPVISHTDRSHRTPRVSVERKSRKT